MRVVIRWANPAPRLNAAPEPVLAASRDQRLRDILMAAQRTLAGRHAGITPELAQLPEGELRLAMDRVQPTELELLRNQLDAFRNPDAPQGSRYRRLRYPLTPAPRTAILMNGFIEDDRTLCFPEGWTQELERFRAEALVGPVVMLKRMANSIFCRGAWFPYLRRPILALTGLPFADHGRLSEEDRDLLWRAFGVPVYEHFLGLSNELLAWECEAHQGLHVEPDHAWCELDPQGEEHELLITSLVNLSEPVVRLRTGLAAQITHEACACGQTGARLTDMRPLSRVPLLPEVPPPPVTPRHVSRVRVLAASNGL